MADRLVVLPWGMPRQARQKPGETDEEKKYDLEGCGSPVEIKGSIDQRSGSHSDPFAVPPPILSDESWGDGLLAGVFLTEFLDPSGGIHDFLFTGIEGMTG